MSRIEALGKYLWEKDLASLKEVEMLTQAVNKFAAQPYQDSFVKVAQEWTVDNEQKKEKE